MGTIEQQQYNIDRKVILKIIEEHYEPYYNSVYTPKIITTEEHIVVCSQAKQSVAWGDKDIFNVAWHGERETIVVSFEQIKDSFEDLENPTPEEFTMFKIQYGVDWIVEPLK